jgi:magnesium chelatase family protein
MYPCPCGWYSDPQKACGCAPAVVTKYQKRISSPLLDRIDIHIEVPRVDYEKLSGDRMEESSETIRKRVQAARNIQQQRFAGHGTDVICNADMRVGEIRQFCRMQDEGQSLMRAAMTQLNLSARPIAASSTRPARSQIWQGVKRSNPRIWRRRCNTDRS